jgi:hypothetical protein
MMSRPGDPGNKTGPDSHGSVEGRALAAKILDHALHWLGVPYQWGGNSKGGVDCSGLVQQVFSKEGISLPRIADQQSRVGKPVSSANARPGDLVYFDENPNDSNGTGADHIGIYIGHGKMIVAPHTGTVVQIQDVGNATGFDRVLDNSAWHGAGMEKHQGGFAWQRPDGQPIGDAPMGATGSAKDGSGAKGDPVPSAKLSHGDIRQGLNAMGFASQLLNSNHSLKQAFQEILRKQIPVDTSAGQARARAIIENTDWWQNHTKAQRSFDMLRYSDPETWKQAIGDTRASLLQLAQQSGVHIGDNELDQLAHVVARNGLTSQEQGELIAHHFDYNPHKGYTGTAGQAIDNVKATASAYYVPVSDQRIQHLTREVIAGNLDPNSLNDLFKEHALSMFPYLKKQLDNNHTIADIADPYVQAYANTLEVDPASIKPRDPLVMQALQARDHQSGELGVMPLWQFQQHLYDDPRWLETQNAKQSLTSTTGQVLQKLGLIS